MLLIMQHIWLSTKRIKALSNLRTALWPLGLLHNQATELNAARAPGPHHKAGAVECLAEAVMLILSRLMCWQADALVAAAGAPNTVDAVVVFEDGGAAAPGARYTIRANHTGLPSTRVVYNAFDILPDSQYRDYWFFANLQLALDRCAAPGCLLHSNRNRVLVFHLMCPPPSLACGDGQHRFLGMRGQQPKGRRRSQQRMKCCMRGRRMQH